VLIAFVKKELQLNASLYTLLQILSVSLFEKTEVSRALQIERNTSDSPDDGNQLNLFTFFNRKILKLYFYWHTSLDS
jgi:hypothetical protein